MAFPVVASLLRSLRYLQLAIDQFWAGVWVLRLKLWLQERDLAQSLEKYGEKSMVVRSETEKYRRLDRSLHYWRASPPLIQAALEASENLGVPLTDLRLLAVNREVRQKGTTVHVVNSWAILLLAYPMLALTLVYWAAFTTLFALADAPLVVKLLAIAFTTLSYWILGSGLCLYTTRSYAAARRSGTQVQCAIKNNSLQALAWRSTRYFHN